MPENVHDIKEAQDFRISELEEQLKSLKEDFTLQTGSHKAAVHRQIMATMDKLAELRGSGRKSKLDAYQGRGGASGGASSDRKVGGTRDRGVSSVNGKRTNER